MQVQIDPQSILSKKGTSTASPSYDHDASRPALLGLALSFESQLQLREIREYMTQFQSILDEIRDDLDDFKHNRENTLFLSRTSERLGQICLDADSWRFDSLYDVAFALQKTLLESGGCEASHVRETIHKSLALLSTLVEQCEIDYRKRLAVDYMLERLDRVSENHTAG